MQTVWKVHSNGKYICSLKKKLTESKFDVSQIIFWFKYTCDNWRILDVCRKIFVI